MTTPQPTMTSVVPQVIEWLVAAAKASPRLGGDPVSPVQVYDGLRPPGQGQQDVRALWIGGDPAAPGDPVAEASQTWPVMDRGRTRDEDGAIAIAAQHWDGGTDNKAHRDGAAQIVAGVELLLRGFPQDPASPGDVTMGGLVYWSAVDGPFDWRQQQVSTGALCLVTFHIVYRARLLTATG